MKKNTNPESKAEETIMQPVWHRIFLLIILGYEAAGCLMGGALLIARPDGSYMDMPVDMMHGAFVDFLIPGIILFGLGMLTTAAFISVLRRSPADWLMASLALGGLFIWFWVEIAILRGLHWLHAMWGIPVFLAWVILIPFIANRHARARMQKMLLTCGILSSLWYLIMNLLVPTQYPGYSHITFTVSELSAIGAPTRNLWFLLGTLYPLLYIAFGWGVRRSAFDNRHLRVVGTLMIAYGIITFFWPPMNMREVTAASGSTLSDKLHVAWAMITLLTNMFIMGFGAAAMGRRFRIYTLITFVVFIIFGFLIFRESPGVEANLPTPGIGLWERINIGAFMLWVIVLAFVLLQKEKQNAQRIHTDSIA